MMEMRKIVTSFILVALFIIAIIGFAVNVAEDNNAENVVTEDSRVSTMYENVQDALDSGQETSSKSGQPMLNSSDSSFTEATADFLISSIKAVALGAFGTVNTIFGSVASPLINMLGLPKEVRPVIVTVISSIFMFTMVLLIWKLYKQGD